MKKISLYEWAFYVVESMDENKGPFSECVDMAEVVYQLARSILYDQENSLEFLMKQRKTLEIKPIVD